MEVFCTICDIAQVSLNNDTFPITQTCDHPRDVCHDCLRQHILSRSKVLGWNDINCPTCSQPLQYNDVRRAAPPDDFKRYDKAQLQQAIRNDSSFIACASVTCAATDAGGYCDPEYDSWVTCEQCNERTCTTCRRIYHSGTTCEENQKAEEERTRAAEIKVEENQTMQHLARFPNQYKICPNKRCRARITKDGGCNHVTCKAPISSQMLSRRGQS